MIGIETYEEDGCHVTIWADGHSENPNDWNAGAVAVVTFGRQCQILCERHLSIKRRGDVRRFLSWSEEVPPAPGPEPEEPDSDDYGNDEDGDIEYDKEYAFWESEHARWLTASEARDAYEDWDDQHLSGYRVFTVNAYVHGGVSLSFGEEITYEEEDEFERAYGFVVIRCAPFEKPVSATELFLHEAAGTQPDDHVLLAAANHVETVAAWVEGDVCGFTVQLPNGEEESCGGFYGDAGRSGIKEEIEGHISWWRSHKARFLAETTPEQRSEWVKAQKLADAEDILAQGDDTVVAYLCSEGFELRDVGPSKTSTEDKTLEVA